MTTFSHLEGGEPMRIKEQRTSKRIARAMRQGAGGVGLLLALGSCGGDVDDACRPASGGGDRMTGGEIDLVNDTAYLMTFDIEGQPLITVDPDSSTIAEVPATRTITARWLTETGETDSLWREVSCCDFDCGMLRLFQDPTGEAGVLLRAYDGECAPYDPGTCDSHSDGGSTGGGDDGGSCPYVFVHDGERFRLSGEALVGSLNQGAQRTDVFALPELKSNDGRYQVRLAAVLRETDFIDQVALRLVDHPAGTQVLPDSSGELHVVGPATPPVQATDSTGQDVLASIRSEDPQHWVGRSRTAKVHDQHRDWLELEFARPAGAEATLLVRGRNTQFIQDSYHRYMAQFGGGAQTALRWLSGAPGYAEAIEALMEQGSFGIDVEVHDGSRWQSQGAVRAIGPAGMRTVALPLGKAGSGSADAPALIRVRLSVVPGAWELDSVALAPRRSAELRETSVLPHQAQHGLLASVGAEADVETVHRIDGQRQRIPHGHHLTVHFRASAQASHLARTAILSVTGYYEEHRPSLLRRYNLVLLPTIESFLVPEHFTSFVLDALQTDTAG